ncbi:aftiphilin-like [Salvelinus fontinalis]|uniref:aftiphilin-like n=1 Tax=Salvelinus fontinalis TaxID=8038 RepID=UPI002485ABAC|nr:aftiphilin-like [Salvelinus fontinalis]
MEQEVMPIYSSSPPPLDDESGGEEDDDEFGDFSGGVAMPSNQPCPSTTDPASPTPSTVRFSVSNSSSFAGTTHSNGISKQFRAADDLKKPRAPVVDQSQPANTGTSEVGRVRPGLEVKGQPCHCNLPDLPLTNGFTKRRHQGTMSAGLVPAGLGSPSQEQGFADFSAFAEPEMELEPWCCGFTHSTEHRKDGRMEGTNLTNGFCNAHSVQKDIEQRARIEPGGPDSQCLAQQGDRDCTGVQQHYELRGHPQDSGLLAPTEVLCARGEGLGEPGERAPSINRDSTLTRDPELGGRRAEEEEDKESETEDSVSPFPTTVSGSVSEEFASSGEAVSSDALEEFGDFGETVFTPSSIGEEEKEKEEVQRSDLMEETETKMVEEEEEEEDFGNFRDAGSFPSQEDFADFNQSESRTQEGFGDFDQDYSEDPGPTQACGEEVGHGDLPLSDSFADFHSAPLEGQGEREEGWGAYGDQRGLSEGETWAEFGEEDRARRTEEAEEKKGGESFQGGAAVRRDSLQASLSIRLQRVLQTSFPAVAVPELDQEREETGVEGEETVVEEEETGVEGEETGMEEEEEDSGVGVLKVLSLRALLETLDTQPEEEETKGLNHTTRWVPRGAWRQPQDLHDAVGLGFQWGGSHSNRALLRCLGMDTRNMLFTGQRKQPVIVPVFAASLGMLEPTKEPLRPASAVEKTAATAQALPGSQETTTTSSIQQGAPQPWSQFDWSSSGLGVNRLDELDSDTSSRPADTLNHLMSTMENTTTSTRKPHRDEEDELSEEAARVICGLADLSFMKAKVLMFPITLTPAAGSGTLLE